ncbi:tripartite tricarboxylate transporter permease, partial [Mycobacterium kansasii]
IDQISGTERFTFGSANLFDGISLVIVAVGMLALGEIIIVASRIRRDPAPKALGAKAGRAWLSKAEFKEALPAWGRGTAIGL